MGKGKGSKGFWIIKPKKNAIIIQFISLNFEKIRFLKMSLVDIFVNCVIVF